jgi:hypothetical protein
MSIEVYKSQIPPSFSRRLAKEMRSFGPTGIFVLGVILLSGTIYIAQVAIPFGAIFVLLWTWLSRTPWREIGYIRPRSWGRTILAGIAFGFIFKLFTKSVVMPILGAGPINLVYHYLSGNRAQLPYAIWIMVVAGFAEETVFRGFLFERFGKLFGQRKWTGIVTVALTSLWFGFAHIPNQGYMGAVHGFIFGLVFGTLYSFRCNLFLLMIAHAFYDLTALALIYWNLETEVAHFFFR